MLEAIVENKRQSLWATFETMSMWDEATLKTIHDTQNFLQGMKFLVWQCKVQDIYEWEDLL